MKRIFFYLTGLFILNFGLAITIISHFGTNHWGALGVALTNHLGLTVGMWLDVIQILFLFVNAILLKKKPAFSSLFAVIIGGFFTDICLFLLKNITFETSAFFIQGIVFTFGIVLCALGIAVYVLPEFPPAPFDQVIFAVSERFRLSIFLSSMIISGIISLFAYFLNGPIGFGTLINIFITGYFIQFFIRNIKPYYGK